MKSSFLSILICIVFLLPSIKTYSQKLSFEEDTARISAGLDHVEVIADHYLDSALKLSERFISESKAIEYTRGITSGYRWAAHLQTSLGNYEISQSLYQELLPIYKKLNDREGLAAVANSMGFNYHHLGKEQSAIESFTKGLEIYQTMGDGSEIANCYNNLGSIYQDQELYDEAREYYDLSIEAAILEGDQSSVATGLNNIGTLHYYRGHQDSCIYYIKKALPLFEITDDIDGSASAYSSLGFLYEEQGLIDSAHLMYERSIALLDNGGFPDNLSTTLVNYATLFYGQNDFQKSLEYSLEGLKIAEELKEPHLIDYAAHSVYSSHHKLGNYKEALEMFQLSKKMEDSIHNMANKSAALQNKYAFEYQNQKKLDSLDFAYRDELKSVQLKEAEVRDEKKNILIYAAVALAIILAIFGVVIFRRFKTSQKQKKIIQLQKDMVDEKNNEIMDSIKYAKRLQSAILPPAKLVRSYLEKSFILYKPKDIVAGDFYWMEPKDDKILFAAADCTGHGVPGAMVSVICNNGLNRAVREHGITDPGKILDKTRQIVIEEFAKSEEDVKDGMDIALCSLEGFKLEYAGAHNPLWIVRNQEIIEIKADKQPIGNYSDSKPYKTHKIDLLKGDSIYIFSDGYSDQFGGEKGKKFKPANFRKLILSIQDQSMEKQKALIENAFEKWRGDLEQIDDVCIIGVEV